MSTEPQQSQPDPQGPEKSEPEQRGVVFPAAGDGRRSTSALGRAVVADALPPPGDVRDLLREVRFVQNASRP